MIVGIITVFCFATLLFCVSCSSTKKATNTSVDNTSINKVEDGLSFETAIVIHEKSEMVGVNAEYKWIREYYPSYKTKM